MRRILNKHSVTVILIIAASSFLFYGITSGITGRTKKNGVGCTCHDPNLSANIIVKINGPDTLLTGQTADYSVTIEGGPLVRGGTNIASSAGILSPISSDLKLEFNDELTHTAPKESENGKVTFDFLFTAPSAPGVQTLYANVNSVNFNGFNDGDKWNFAENKLIHVFSPTSIYDENIISSYNLEQNYPNPFSAKGGSASGGNPSTKIHYTIPAVETGHAPSLRVTLKVFDALGNEVATLVDEYKSAGSYQVEFDASDLSSGVYFYRLQAGNFTETKKMLLLR